MPEDDECYKNLGRKYVWYKDFMVKKIYPKNVMPLCCEQKVKTLYFVY